MKERIAVMGGTFDPIHYGHLVAAEAVRHVYELKKVLFIPAGCPPHKKSKDVSKSELRYLMTVLATAGNPYFEASRIEIDRPGTTYTIDTINALRERYKDAKFYFITGADAVQQILTWKDADKLLKRCSFVAVTRPGYNRESLCRQIKHLKEKYSGKVHLLEVPGLAISSSDIRSRVSRGDSIKYLLPEEVERCILKAGLYWQPETASDLDAITGFLKAHLGRKRYAHTIGTAGEAVRLAKKHGADPLKAYTAALLHDCAKGYDETEQKKLCEMYGIKPDPVIGKQFDLIHGYLSAEIARRDFSIEDTDMLNAIRYHTTGRTAMSLMEKIIYLADCIEPGRELYPGLMDIRESACRNLDRALHDCLAYTVRYNREKDRLIHPLSVEALEYYTAEHH